MLSRAMRDNIKETILKERRNMKDKERRGRTDIDIASQL
jgi:hypothetical protein